MRNVHFIGICGAGMSAAALLLKEQGAVVTGSDEGVYPPISDLLVERGIPFTIGYAPRNIPSEAETIVVGKHAGLTPDDNEEVRAAFASGVPVRSFPEVLAELTADRRRIVVAGSYGKSTCTTLLAWCLERAGRQPGYFIGAQPLTPTTNARLGETDVFIFEGDEYPSSNWDPMSKFIHYRPQDLLLTALSHDHVNVFPTHASYVTPFLNLIDGLPDDGLLMVCTDDPTVRSRLPDWNHPNVQTYGFHKGAGWHPMHVTYGAETTFELTHPRMRPLRLTTQLLGAHNVQNIIGSAALLLSLDLLAPEEVREGVATFKGLRRRLDRLSMNTSIPLYEGFGSSYEKTRAAIEAMRLHFPERRLFVVFEPHTFSWRNRETLPWYDTAFSGAASVFVYKPPSHGAETHDQLSLAEIVERISAARIPVMGFSEKHRGLERILDRIDASTVVLVLTSGDLGGLIPELVRAIDERPPE
jgi:UDP-N-acetylmuramate: L-alanyl-gamma-D-glutamyl-meso-diaminopimelate ligase